MKTSTHESLFIAAIMLLIGSSAFMYLDEKIISNGNVSCHTFQRTDTSHIRLNSCTGEAHVIVRGPNGFEWQKIIE